MHRKKCRRSHGPQPRYVLEHHGMGRQRPILGSNCIREQGKCCCLCLPLTVPPSPRADARPALITQLVLWCYMMARWTVPSCRCSWAGKAMALHMRPPSLHFIFSCQAPPCASLSRRTAAQAARAAAGCPCKVRRPHAQYISIVKPGVLNTWAPR